MNAKLEFNLDVGMYVAYVVIPSQLRSTPKTAAGTVDYYWTSPEAVEGYGDNIEEAVDNLRRQLEIQKANSEG